MRLLGEFFEKNGQEAGEMDTCYRVRKSVRGVVVRQGNEIAVVPSEQNDHHRLPGGSVRKNEDLEMALKREILKKAGCEIEVRRPGSVGAVIEYRDSKEILRISYCYVADVVRREKEIDLEWMNIDEVIDIIEKETPDEESEQFVRNRDLLFLQEARKRFFQSN